jgi:D-glycerate 3-kinase
VANIDAFLRSEGVSHAAVEQIHEPLADWVMAKRAGRLGALFVGLCGAQGSGKSTAAVLLQHLLEAKGLSVAALSIDDLYLTHAERVTLAQTIHPLLATRGPPGTHELGLGEAVIASLRRPGPTAIPSFDKSIDDRRPREEWPVFHGPADVILLEGWCVGARPEPPEALIQPVNSLEREEDPDGIWRRYVNQALDTWQPFFAQLDCLVLFAAPSFEVVKLWRGEQEAKLKGSGETHQKHVMSAAELARFIHHYERLTRWILAEAPGRVDALVELSEARQLKKLTVADPGEPREP